MPKQIIGHVWNFSYLKVHSLKFFVFKFHWSGLNSLAMALIWSKTNIHKNGFLFQKNHSLSRSYFKQFKLQILDLSHLNKKIYYIPINSTVQSRFYIHACQENNCNLSKNSCCKFMLNWAQAVNTYLISNWYCG